MFENEHILTLNFKDQILISICASLYDSTTKSTRTKSSLLLILSLCLQLHFVTLMQFVYESEGI